MSGRQASSSQPKPGPGLEAVLLGFRFDPPAPAARQRCGHRQASLRLSRIPSHESLQVPVTHDRKLLSGSPWPEYLAAPTALHNGRNRLPRPAVTRHGPSSRCLSHQPRPGPVLPQPNVRVTRRGPTSLAARRHWQSRSLSVARLTRHGPPSLTAARVTRGDPSHSPRPESLTGLRQAFWLAAAPVTPGLRGPPLLAATRVSQVRVARRDRRASSAAARSHSRRPESQSLAAACQCHHSADRRHSPRPEVTRHRDGRRHSPSGCLPSLATARLTRHGLDIPATRMSKVYHRY